MGVGQEIDCLFNLCGQVVHDDLITRYQGGNEDLLDIGKGRPHSSAASRSIGAVRPSRRRPAVKVVVFQCPWDRGTATLATLRAATQAGHFGRGPGLVDEHQPAGIEIGLALEPGPAARGDVRALLLGGVRGFFLKLMMAIEEPPHRAGPDRQVALFQPATATPRGVMSGVSSTLASKNSAAPSLPSRPPVSASRIGRGAARPAPHIGSTQRMASTR